jgi:tRNA(Ile)-lysidine synthase TilS/MesJ
MGISGGLDSSYLAYLGHVWGLRILGVHIDDGFDIELAKENIKKLCEKCNINLINVKLNSIQYNDLTKAFILADVPNIAMPQDNILFANLYYYAKKNKIKTFLSGGNFALESILKSSEPVNVFDMKQMRDIHNKFGTESMDELLFTNNFQRVFDRYIFKIKSIRPLNYVDYNKERALKELSTFCDFQYYEYKHCENILTKFTQLYWLVEKFNDDKRKSHLSSLIISNQLTREKAIELLNAPLYNQTEMSKDIDLLCKDLKLDRKCLDEIINRDGKKHSDYKTSYIYKIVIKYFSNFLVKFKG